MRIACVGSRDTSADLCLWMEELGKRLVKAGHTIVSGNAPGADQAWACGGNQVNPANVELHLPWARFERDAVVKGNVVLVFDNLDESIKKKYLELAQTLHPAWHNVSKGAEKLHGRNVSIVEHTDRVFGNPNPKRAGGGGTGMAFRVADHFKIPTFDVGIQSIREQLMREFS